MFYALRVQGLRGFYHRLVANHHDMFPALPQCTRLFLNLDRYRAYADEFLARPSLLGVIDSYGIELIHPHRERRSTRQIAKKGKSK